MFCVFFNVVYGILFTGHGGGDHSRLLMLTNHKRRLRTTHFILVPFFLLKNSIMN